MIRNCLEAEARISQTKLFFFSDLFSTSRFGQTKPSGLGSLPLTGRVDVQEDNQADSRPALPGLHVRVCSRSQSSGRLRAPRGGHEPSARL